MSDWREVLLGDIADILTGHPFKSQYYTQDAQDPRLVGGDNIAQGFLRWDNVRRWPRSRPEGLNAFWLQPGDVLLAMDRPWIDAGLKRGVIGREDLPALLVQRTARLRGSDKLDTAFLRYIIGSRDFTQYVLGVQTGTAIPHISPSQIKGFRFLLPPLSEQKAIASVLGALDDKIELNRRMNATLEAMARALFQSWFVDFDPVRAKLDGGSVGLDLGLAEMFPSGFQASTSGHKPNGWTEETLGDCVGFQSGFAFKSHDWQNAGVPVVKIGSVKPGIVDLSQVSYVSESIAANLPRFRLSVGDLLIGMTGYVGEVGLIPPTNILPLLNQRVGKIVLPTSGTGSLAYWYCTTRQQEFRAFVEGRSHGTAQANVSGEAILSFPIVRPPSMLIDTFNRLSQPNMDRILANHAQSRTLAALRDNLLPKLLSGELSVKNLESQVAAVV